MSHHPLYLGPSDTKLRGVWVRHKVTNAIGYISHVERTYSHTEDGVIENPPVLWIVYLPGRHNKAHTPIKNPSAGMAYADEVKRLKRRRKEL